MKRCLSRIKEHPGQIRRDIFRTRPEMELIRPCPDRIALYLEQRELHTLCNKLNMEQMERDAVERKLDRGQMKLYVVQMERCQDNIKLYQRQMKRDLLQMKRDVEQITCEEQQIEHEKEQIERVFPCLMFDRPVLSFHPEWMGCRESKFAALRCLFACNRKELERDVNPFSLAFLRSGGRFSLLRGGKEERGLVPTECGDDE